MSPRGIFRNKTSIELAALRVIAEDRLTHGDRTSLSGAGKSSGRTFSMSAYDMLREIEFAEGLLTGGNGLTRSTHFDASGQIR